MNIKNTYLGFTDNKKPMQAARIQNTLDKLIRYEGNTMTEKEFVYEELKKAQELELDPEYSYYSSRIGDYTKPRKLYTLNGYEINKTLYDFAHYILDNNLLEENKVKSIIDKEIKKAKEEEKQEELRRKEEELKRQQEEKERKEKIRQKQQQWIEQGKEFIKSLETNPITALLEKYWNDIKKVYTDEEKDKFFEYATNRLTMMLGNKNGCIGWMKYFIEKDNDPDSYKVTLITNPMQFLEKELLYNVFSDVQVSDPEVTITAKVKAKLENREYKGGKEVKKHKFYWHNRKENKFIECYGQKFNFDGIIGYLKVNDNGMYSIIEARTGASLSSRKTIKEVKDVCKKFIEEERELINKQIEKIIDKNGLSPLYKEESITG